MLERVRLQPQSVRVDPLNNARSWNIPIYSIQEIFTRLEKICAKAGSSSKSPGLKVLRGHYLKIETGKRPEFKQLREWPTINLKSQRGESPFVRPHHDSSQRVNKKASKDGSERLAGGYCEMCRVDFADLKTHVLTQQHVALANNTDYYAHLDTIIQSKTINAFLNSQMCASAGVVGAPRRCLRSGSVDVTMGSRNSSLATTNGHILPRHTRASTRSLDDNTKKPLEVQCNGIINHNHLTRAAVKSDSVLTGLCEGISRRTRTISASCPGTNNEFSQLSPTGSDITHHLRSRKQMWLPTNLLGTTAEDVLSGAKARSTRDYPASDGLKSPTQGKGPLKSPPTPIAEDFPERKSKSKNEEDRSQSKSPAATMYGDETDKSRSQGSSDTEDDAETKDKSGSAKSKEKCDNNKKPAAKKGKKPLGLVRPRELANLSYENKRKKVQKKRLSVEEKLIEDNRTYYKVEVLNSKLRSTGYYITQSQRELEMSKANGSESCVTQNCTEPAKTEVKAEEKEPVVVRFKKVRQTELSLLSDEAESFMFGEPYRRESSVSTESSDEDDEVSLKLESEDQGRFGTKIKKEVLDDSSMGSCSITSSSTSSRRKRKSPDESILHDNAEYYKFESTGSRLRYGNLFTPLSRREEVSIKQEAHNDSKSGSLKVKLDENDFEPEKLVDEVKDEKYSLSDLTFAFETSPVHEPWYQTFKRQDDCNEFHYRSYTTYPKVLLPYEYPKSVIRQFRVAAVNLKNKKRKEKKEKRLQKIIVDDKPRKSPRCHASTLAIMSSLMRRRPRDSPEKKSEPLSEISLVSGEVIQDEESRCSTIIDPPSVAPSDTQMSATLTPVQNIPEIRVESKPDPTPESKAEADVKKAEEDIDCLFTEVFTENDDDLLVNMLQAIKKEVESSPVKDTKKGKSKAKSVKKEATAEFLEATTCLPVDNEILMEENGRGVYHSGPTMGVMNLIDSYRSCSSMERADYEHLNPHAVDALRVLIAESCNSSDCGGSSACDYSFLEDGKICKKRKRKKRNMTGWPSANNRKKFSRKNEDLSTVVLRRTCRLQDGQTNELDSLKDSENELVNDLKDSEIEVNLKEEPSASLNDTGEHSVDDGDVKNGSEKSDTKPGSIISRTTSIDSSSIKSFDVQSCVVRVKKMTDGCVETFSRHRQLRSADSSPPNRRGSSRQAKIIGMESLRRCR